MPHDSNIEQMASSGPPDAAMSGRQRRLFWILAFFFALTRLWALAPTAWDWDEMLFSLAVRDYDVALHHPHPPGFPLYVGLAKLIRPFFPNDFRALQSISLLAGMLLFPGTFKLAREIGLSFREALGAAAITIAFPNVWFYGGTAFSDVPSLACIVWAAALLLAGRRSPRTYLTGMILYGCAMAIRPQNLLIGLGPMVLAAWALRKRPMIVITGAVAGAAIVLASFGIAAAESGGWARYKLAVDTHQRYIATVDSWRNPARPSLRVIFGDFLLRQYQFLAMGHVCTLFALIALVAGARKRLRSTLMILLLFAPLAVVAAMMLDRFSINRFALGYMPMFSLLAAQGMSLAAAWLERKRNLAWIYACFVALVSGGFLIWAAAPLAEVRSTPSPSIAAMEWIEKNHPPSKPLYIGFAMKPFREYFLPDRDVIVVLDHGALALARPAPGAVLVAEGQLTGAIAQFSRSRGRLWKIARHHFFDVGVRPMGSVDLVRGWSEVERTGEGEQTLMADEAEVGLPATRTRADLELTVAVPETIATPVRIRVIVNGVERWSGNSSTDTFRIRCTIPPAPRNHVLLRVEADEPRRVGLLLLGVSLREKPVK